MESFIGTLAANVGAGAVQEKIREFTGQTDAVKDNVDQNTMMVIGQHYKHHIDPVRVGALPDKVIKPFNLHIASGSSTGRVKVDLNMGIQRIKVIRLMVSKLEGYAADDMFKLEFHGSMTSGMHVFGRDNHKPNSIILPTALTVHGGEGMELARWPTAAGKLESITVQLRSVNGEAISWDDLFLNMEVELLSWN